MLVFDIETVPDMLTTDQESWFVAKRRDTRLKDPAKIAANEQKIKEKFALSPLTGKIILIGMASDKQITPDFQFDNETGFYILQAGLKGETEKEILDKFWDVLVPTYSSSQRIVSFNGKRFDLPFILARSVINGVRPRNELPMIDSFLSKYSNQQHVDLYIVLGEQGSLSEWANRILPDEPLASDGEMIQYWFDKGEYDEILAKNKDDLMQTGNIFKRLEYWV